MKPMALNLSKMKKISSDSKTTTFKHDDGHEIKILHSALPALQREQLKRLPAVKMADGGTVPSPTPQPTPVVAQDSMRKAFHYADGTDNAGADAPMSLSASDVDPNAKLSISNDKDIKPQVDAASAEQTPTAASAASALGNLTGQDPTPAPQAASVDQSTAPQAAAPTAQPGDAGKPIIPADLGGNVQSAVDEGTKGLQGKRDVDEQMSKAVLSNDDTQARQDNLQHLNDATDYMRQHAHDFLDHLQQEDINPKHYLENMSSGSKISTGIGLFLGGLGSAFTGGSNPAMDFLNKQIDRDIEGQRMRMDKDKTLLGANRQIFEDEGLANNLTRVNMNDIYDTKMKQAAAKLGTPQAQANYQLAHSQWQLQNQQLLQQSAMRSTVLAAAKRGGAGLDAIDLAHAGMMSPEQAEKEQTVVDGAKRAVDATKSLFSQLGQQQHVGNRVLNPLQSSSQIDSMNAQLATIIQEADPSKRLTPESAKLEISPFKVKLSDNEATRKEKLQGALNLIRNKNEGGAPTMAKYAPQSLPQYDLPEIKHFSGAAYQKVNGGWKKVSK